MRKYRSRKRKTTLSPEDQATIRSKFQPGNLAQIARDLKISYSRAYWFAYNDGLIEPNRRDSGVWEAPVSIPADQRPPAVYSNKNYQDAT